MEHIDRDKILNTMVEFSHDGILFLDPGGKILQANPAACSIFGFDSVSEIQQRSYKFTEFLFTKMITNRQTVTLHGYPMSDISKLIYGLNSNPV
jgi:PAS domain-containing protein